MGLAESQTESRWRSGFITQKNWAPKPDLGFFHWESQIFNLVLFPVDIFERRSNTFTNSFYQFADNFTLPLEKLRVSLGTLCVLSNKTWAPSTPSLTLGQSHSKFLPGPLNFELSKFYCISISILCYLYLSLASIISYTTPSRKEKSVGFNSLNVPDL